jgi:hypothetical protein
MKNFNWKKCIPHLIAVVIFVLISAIYFSPVLEGKRLEQQDVKQHKGMSEEIAQHRINFGEEPLWTNSMFSGMPAYQISVLYKKNLISYFSKIFKLYLPAPIGTVFLYLLGFYFLVVSLGIDYRLAILGAIAFAFSSYFFIIIEAGHNAKAHAIGYLAPILASVLMVFRGKVYLGSALTAFFTALMVNANHLQITYYLILLLIILGLVQLFKAFKEQNLPIFFKQFIVLILAGLLGASTSATRLLTTIEYGKESTRGKSELNTNSNNQTSGLDIDYATAWSYGKAESLTLLIPNFHGGASGGALGTDSETYKLFKNSAQSNQAKQIIKQLPLYWGNQPFTSGPVYAGAIICFLFVMALFLQKGYTAWWIFSTLVLMLALSWGKNFMPLTDFFLNYFPGYNKFRAVSTTLVIVELLMPLLAVFALHKVINEGKTDKIISALKYSFGITAGLCLIFALLPSLFFDFVGLNDQQYGEALANALQIDRASLLQSDAFRSFMFISLAFVAIWLYFSKTIKTSLLILIIGALLLGDMWSINKRYLNAENFKPKRKVDQPFSPTTADQQILRDSSLSYRVYNTTVSPFNDAYTSYYHQSIGGYHGAKLQRYQELIDNHISRGNMQVLNMLNTKYFIVKGQSSPIAQLNTNALGNAWFVEELIEAQNADDEIQLLGQINTAKQATVDLRYERPNFVVDTTANIHLTQYRANHLVYQSSSKTDQFAVFSEIYYDKGWNAYIDGQLAPHIRVNYVLRGLTVPSGNHTIEFKFEPKTYHLGENISLASSLLLLLILFGVLYKELKA